MSIQIVTKDQAMVKIINYLNNMLAGVNHHNTNTVVELAIVHNISAVDLINKYHELCMNV